MELKELGTLIAKSAPLLGGVLNAFLPGSGLLISGLCKLFNVNTASELPDAIQADSQAALKLQQFELEHQTALITLQNQNVQAAREREEIILNAGKRDWVMDFLTIFITVAFLSLTMVVAFVQLPNTTHDIFYMLLGAFAGGFSCILNFYFGASVQTKLPPNKNNVILPPPAQTR